MISHSSSVFIRTITSTNSFSIILTLFALFCIGNILGHPKNERISDFDVPTIDEHMHGVMMHGDDKPGKAHTEPKEEKQENVQSGVETIDEHLHGVMMHGDEKAGKVHEHEVPAEEENKKSSNIETADDHLHGVLMHADDNPGEKHIHEKDPEDPETRKFTLETAEDYLHGVLMHNDDQPGEKHEHDEQANEDENVSFNVKDPPPGWVSDNLTSLKKIKRMFVRLIYHIRRKFVFLRPSKEEEDYFESHYGYSRNKKIVHDEN